MQLLNTDFKSPNAGECIEMNVIFRFRSHLQNCERASGVDYARTQGETPAAEDVLVNAMNFRYKLSGSRFGSLWYHTCILGERMALNYSR